MSKPRITASMLYGYTMCPHRVHLDVHGDPAERDPVNPFVELLWERGDAFEERTMRELGAFYLNLGNVPRDQRERMTRQAMADGEPLIYGGRIAHGRLLGEPDLLRRADGGYTAGDIKSGAGVEGISEDADGKPKKHYAVQLALYADVLRKEGLSQSMTAFIWDVHGREVSYDFARPRSCGVRHTMQAEYEAVLADAEAIVDRTMQTRPALIGACSLCHWRTHCRREIVAADDLTLIPDLGRSRREKFPKELATVAALAGTRLEDLIVDGKSSIPGIGEKMLRSYHARAVLQKQPSPTPVLAESVVLPSATVELFFDVETDPFRDLCYLHGFVERRDRRTDGERYIPFFADEVTGDGEREAFAAAWAYVCSHPRAAVYYYSHYERTIWRQLAARYPDVASEEDVLSLFDDERFVDLYTDVTRSRMVWPTTSLSLKPLAAFLGFTWRDSDPSGAGSIEWFHRWVETGDPSIRQRILDYNEDDCRATRVLVDAIRELL